MSLYSWLFKAPGPSMPAVAETQQAAVSAGAFERALDENNERLWTTWPTGGRSAAGEMVTPLSAMQVAAVMACVTVLAQDLAKLPTILYRRTGPNSRERVTQHPAHWLVHDEPNGVQTPVEFCEQLISMMLLGGNGYSVAPRDNRGQVVSLVNVPFTRVQPMTWSDGLSRELYYRVTTWSGEQVTVPAENMLHLREWSFDGVVGVSRITWQRETVGQALGMQTHSSAFFANGASPGGVLEHPGQLSDEAKGGLSAHWNEIHQGAANAHKVAVLEEGMTFRPIMMSHKDAQWLEGRKLSRTEIASIFRVPPHKIGDLEKATYSNIEQQSQDYVSDGLMPLARRWEQRLRNLLLTERERADGFFFEVLFDALLRGDTATRYAAYQSAITTGWMAPNEARALENMPPREGGDELRVPLNTAPASQEGNGDEA